MSGRYECGHDNVGSLAIGPPDIHEPLGGPCPVCKQLRGLSLGDDELDVQDRRQVAKPYPWMR